MSKRANEFISAKEAILDMLQQHKLQKGIDKVNAKEAWKTVMGNGVFSYTEAVELKRDILIIKLSSATLREELSYGKEKIVEMMNANMGKSLIKKVKLL